MPSSASNLLLMLDTGVISSKERLFSRIKESFYSYILISSRLSSSEYDWELSSPSSIANSIFLQSGSWLSVDVLVLSGLS
jgi:hypothetical protein